jgi:hypothetical protein
MVFLFHLSTSYFISGAHQSKNGMIYASAARITIFVPTHCNKNMEKLVKFTEKNMVCVGLN